jgi:4'-phosphopantetheinyl transferase EntD
MIAGVIEEILPAGAVAVDTREDLLDSELFPEERAALGDAVEKRRREFISARACAHRALAQLGLPRLGIATGDRGEPLWPEGVVGSITHCDGYRACAVARALQIATLGIDAEPNEPLPAGVLDEIALAEERDALGDLVRAEPAVRWDRFLFSAKEAVYKAWFPLARRWLGFEDVALSVDLEERSFGVRLLVSDPPPAARRLQLLAGRWLVRDGLLLTAVALPAGESPGPG